MSKKKLILIGLFGLFLFVLKQNWFSSHLPEPEVIQTPPASWWKFQAIDTMKYSRDPSREFLQKIPELRTLADQQVSQIAQTGATHVGIATPYDEEFAPILEIWIDAARRYNLKIWFRGNWSGWEGWFGYPRITREQHLTKSTEFVLNHPHYFEAGDVFSACPECENGGPGDPRLNGDAAGHRRFLIAEHQALQTAFTEINRQVQTNFNSMNGDVARLIMDPATTEALGGLVVVDHYVRTPTQLNQDISDFAQRSGGQVVLGEFGAPIPDINGSMTESQQAMWVEDTLKLLQDNPDLVGLSYWTNMGGSTALWNNDGSPRAGVYGLTQAYRPNGLQLRITNTLDQAVAKIAIQSQARDLQLSATQFQITYLDENQVVTISAPNYQAQTISIAELKSNPKIQLVPLRPSLWYTVHRWLYRNFGL